MAETSSQLGTCPSCGNHIPGTSLLIEYETPAGDTDCFAECVVCDDVVHPR